MAYSGADLAVARRVAEAILGTDGTRIRRIILFGSRARGDAKPDSDLDLLVVTRQATPTEQRAYRQSLYRVCRGFGLPVEPHVMSEETFEESRSVIGGLAYPASTEGVTLYWRDIASENSQEDCTDARRGGIEVT
jgi:predicted nucleotidyltransferase